MIWEYGHHNIVDDLYLELLDFYIIKSPSIFKRGHKKIASSKKSINIYETWGTKCFTSYIFKKEYLKYDEHKILGLYDNNFGFSSTQRDIKEKVESNDLLKLSKADLNSFDLTPRIAMVDNKSNQFVSFLSHIRNAFAHGSFIFFKGYFIFQDSYHRNLTGRGVVKIKTLLFLKKLILNDFKD